MICRSGAAGIRSSTACRDRSVGTEVAIKLLVPLPAAAQMAGDGCALRSRWRAGLAEREHRGCVRLREDGPGVHHTHVPARPVGPRAGAWAYSSRCRWWQIGCDIASGAHDGRLLGASSIATSEPIRRLGQPADWPCVVDRLRLRPARRSARSRPDTECLPAPAWPTRPPGRWAPGRRAGRSDASGYSASVPPADLPDRPVSTSSSTDSDPGFHPRSRLSRGVPAVAPINAIAQATAAARRARFRRDRLRVRHSRPETWDGGHGQAPAAPAPPAPGPDPAHWARARPAVGASRNRRTPWRSSNGAGCRRNGALRRRPRGGAPPPARPTCKPRRGAGAPSLRVPRCERPRLLEKYTRIRELTRAAPDRTCAGHSVPASFWASRRRRSCRAGPGAAGRALLLGHDPAHRCVCSSSVRGASPTPLVLPPAAASPWPPRWSARVGGRWRSCRPARRAASCRP